MNKVNKEANIEKANNERANNTNKASLKISTPSITYRGKEYVTQAEFAQRVKASRMTINRYVNKGMLEGISIHGYKAIYLEWEKEKDIYYLMKDAKPLVVKKREVDTLEHFEVATEEEIEEFKREWKKKPRKRNINPNDYPECWILKEDGTPTINPITEAPELNYQLLRMVLINEKYELDLKVARGDFIEKEELMMKILTIARIVQSSLDAIPQKYGDIFIAQTMQILGCSFTGLEKASLKTCMREEGDNIMMSISHRIGALIER